MGLIGHRMGYLPNLKNAHNWIGSTCLLQAFAEIYILLGTRFFQDGRSHLGPDRFTNIAYVPGALCKGGPFLGWSGFWLPWWPPHPHVYVEICWSLSTVQVYGWSRVTCACWVLGSLESDRIGSASNCLGHCRFDHAVLGQRNALGPFWILVLAVRRNMSYLNYCFSTTQQLHRGPQDATRCLFHLGKPRMKLRSFWSWGLRPSWQWQAWGVINLQWVRGVVDQAWKFSGTVGFVL